MDFLFSVLAFAVILIPAIIIHELGHFIAAKMVGIKAATTVSADAASRSGNSRKQFV